MVSAVNTSSFAKKIPKLEGDLTKSGTTIVGTSGSQVSPLSSLVGGEVLQGTIIVTPTEAVNLVFIKFSIYATQDSNIQIREGATVIATVNGVSTGVRTISMTLEDVTVATHTYNCYTQIGNNVYQYSAGGRVFFGTSANMVDTHSTKNTNIIRG